MMKESVRGFN